MAVEFGYFIIGLLYIIAIYFSWKNGYNAGVLAGGEAFMEVLVEEELIQTSVDGDGNVEVSGTMLGCPKCSPYVNRENDTKEA